MEGKQESVERGLIVSFEDQDPRYTYGFEAGMIWQRMQNGETKFDQYIRVENRLTIERMCAARNYGCDFGECEVEGWMIFIAWKREDSAPKFRLIEGGIKDNA